MRTNSMESTRSKTRKPKNHSKLKSSLNPEENEDTETHLLSPVDRVRVSHLATTPVTPAGNIVDMQGSLDQSTPDKIEEEKIENKESVVKNLDSESKEGIQDATKESTTPGENESGDDPENSQFAQKESESSSESKNEIKTAVKLETNAESLEKETAVEKEGNEF